MDMRDGACYVPRQPQQQVLYQVVKTHLGTFLNQMQGGLPRHVERELQSYLTCGDFDEGAACFICDQCAERVWVPFSCKRRGFCPSCCGRRMNDIARHLVQRVLPEVPVRQWVLSLPVAVRRLLVSRPGLVGPVLAVFMRVVFGFLRRATRRLGIADAQCGAVAVEQRFGSAANLNLHFHALVLDGVYHRPDPQGPPVFVRLPEPTQKHVAELAVKLRRRILRWLGKRGIWEEQGPLEGDDDSVLQLLQGASLLGRAALGERAGWRVERIGGEPVGCPALPGELCADAQGFNLHAGVRVIAHRRERLLGLCRYVLRPPLSHERLELRTDGRVVVRLKRPWQDGTRALVFEPLDLIGRLCALVPPPRKHLVHYFGVLGPHSSWRTEIVPQPTEPIGGDGDMENEAAKRGAARKRDKKATRTCWAELLRHTFAVDVLECRCGGRMRFLCWVFDREALRRIRQSLEKRKAERDVRAAEARPPPQLGLFSDGA